MAKTFFLSLYQEGNDSASGTECIGNTATQQQSTLCSYFGPSGADQSSYFGPSTNAGQSTSREVSEMQSE